MTEICFGALPTETSQWRPWPYFWRVFISSHVLLCLKAVYFWHGGVDEFRVLLLPLPPSIPSRKQGVLMVWMVHLHASHSFASELMPSRLFYLRLPILFSPVLRWCALRSVVVSYHHPLTIATQTASSGRRGEVHTSQPSPGRKASFLLL